MFALGALFGLVLGIALALLRERVDRLRHTEDVSAAFDAPSSGHDPAQPALTRHVPFQDLPPKVVEPFFMLQSSLHYRRQGGARGRTTSKLASQRSRLARALRRQPAAERLPKGAPGTAATASALHVHPR